MHDMAWFDDFAIPDNTLSARKSAVLRGCRLRLAVNYLESAVFYPRWPWPVSHSC